MADARDAEAGARDAERRPPDPRAPFLRGLIGPLPNFVLCYINIYIILLFKSSLSEFSVFIFFTV